MVEKLGNKGFTVWIDNDRLCANDDWWDEIVHALRASQACIVLVSPDSKRSNWVKREVLLAERWGKAIFPILLKGNDRPNGSVAKTFVAILAGLVLGVSLLSIIPAVQNNPDSETPLSNCEIDVFQVDANQLGSNPFSYPIDTELSLYPHGYLS